MRSNSERIAAESAAPCSERQPPEIFCRTLDLMPQFSFIRLTSSGFVDSVPMHPLARNQTNLEAVLGEQYFIVLLASLLTLHNETRQHEVS